MGDKRKRVGHRALADLAASQHGVVATSQLLTLGYGRNAVAKAEKVGRLHRVHRGVYAVGHQNLTWHGRCMAAVLAASPSVASHFSAAWLWGLVRSPPGTLHVTCRKSRHAERSFVTHTAGLLRVDLTRREGIPVTSLARTILDCATRTDRARSSASSSEPTMPRTSTGGRWSTSSIARRGIAGGPKVRAALEIYRETPVFTRSGLERRFFEVVTAAGLPVPSMNAFVAGYEIDAWWEAERFGVELDVYETHGSRLSFEEDRIRDDELLLAGIETTRVTGPRLDREPGAVVESVRRHLARRAPGPLE